MKVRIYILATCDSCRKATKWLSTHGISFQIIPIRENPPSEAKLHAALKSTGDIRKLFNTSGQDYRTLGMRGKLPTLSETEALSLLAANGNLIKRPFLVSGTTTLVGFNETSWGAALL